MAIYRLSMQGIRRSDGRSAVAAAAYRSGSQLRDERLEMTFDFRKKEGVEHREIMAPAGTPAALLQREGLWNAAESAERRKDAVPAQEVLISLPHELNAEQRRELVRTFVGESLVKRGMIADFNIHEPDPQGDQRNFHAHILVTTRDVGPDGFGKKNRDWHHASFVSDLRHEWARVQNRELQRHLGQDAPQVSALSLAERGVDRVPDPKMGPAATAMERRGERSERGAWREGARLQQEELNRGEGEARRKMRPENTAWTVRPTGELLGEMIGVRAAMKRQAEELAAHRNTLTAPRPPSKRKLENELTKREQAERRRAEKALNQAREQAEKQGIPTRTLALWFVNPGAAFKATIAAAHRDLDRIGKAQTAFARADQALTQKRAWVRSEAGQAHIDNVREPAVQTAVDVAKKRRTLDRRIKRLNARIRRVNGVVRDLGVAQELKVRGIKVPGKIPGDARASIYQERHIRAIGQPVRAVIAKMPVNVVELALSAIKARAQQPPGPDLLRDDGPER